MNPTETDINQAEIIAADYPCVRVLLDHYNFITQSAVYDSYVIRKKYIIKWNKELEKKNISLINLKDELGAHDNAVNRLVQWFEGQVSFLKDTETLLSMMSQEEKQKAAGELQVNKNIIDIAL